MRWFAIPLCLYGKSKHPTLKCTHVHWYVHVQINKYTRTHTHIHTYLTHRFTHSHRMHTEGERIIQLKYIFTKTTPWYYLLIPNISIEIVSKNHYFLLILSTKARQHKRKRKSFMANKLPMPAKIKLLRRYLFARKLKKSTILPTTLWCREIVWFCFRFS